MGECYSRCMIRYVLLLIMAVGLRGSAQETRPHVVLHTQLGEIEMELDAVHAPATTANFLRYVKGGFYTGGLFHRTVTMQNQPDSPVKIEVIQGGINLEKKKDGFPAIALERTNVTGIKHVDGAVSMARGGPDSATSDFFICIGDQPELDFGGKRNAGWAGVCCVRAGGPRDGCGAEDSGVSG